MYNFGSLVYLKFQLERIITVVYSYSTMGFKSERFRVTYNGLSVQVHDYGLSLSELLVVPPSFCVSLYLSDPRYYYDDEQKILISRRVARRWPPCNLN